MLDVSDGLSWMMHETLENSGLGTRVQYIHAGAETIDVWTGKVTQSTTVREVWGTFAPDETVEEIRDGAPSQATRRVFVVPADRLPGDPSRNDRVLEGEKSYAVTGWRQEATNAAYRLYLRRAG